MKKISKKAKIVAIVLIVIVIAVIGYIVYDKTIASKNKLTVNNTANYLKTLDVKNMEEKEILSLGENIYAEFLSFTNSLGQQINNKDIDLENWNVDYDNSDTIESDTKYIRVKNFKDIFTELFVSDIAYLDVFNTNSIKLLNKDDKFYLEEIGECIDDCVVNTTIETRETSDDKIIYNVNVEIEYLTDVNEADKKTINNYTNELIVKKENGLWKISKVTLFQKRNNYQPMLIEENIKTYGDVNCDGTVSNDDIILLTRYIEGNSTITEQGIKNADVYYDGTINDKDITVLGRHIVNTKGYETLPLTTMPEVETLYGDVNCDGSITNSDLILLSNYLEGTKNLSKEGEKNADVLNDGKIDNNDLEVLSKYLVEYEGYEILPLDKIPEIKTIYGDVDCDGAVSNVDLVLLGRYLEGKTMLTEQAKKNADVLNDGKIDNNDLEVLSKHIVNAEGYRTLPLKVIPKQYLAGDVNCDGEISNSDLVLLSNYILGNTTLTEQGMKNADVLNDNKIDNNDLTVLSRYIVGWEGYETLPLKEIPKQYLAGDVDCDSAVSNADLVLLRRYLEGISTLTEQGKKNADVLNDNKIDNNDLTVLSRYIVGWEGYETLPLKEIPKQYLAGDIDCDGVVSNTDLILLSGYLDGNKNLSEHEIENADILKDGKIDNNDLTVLSRHIVGIKGYETLPLTEMP